MCYVLCGTYMLHEKRGGEEERRRGGEEERWLI
jgi:hypothetical protein